jgi:Domain of unknown function (DUF5753)/Helix-turn-helix domain
MSPSTISRIETAQVGVRPRDVRELLDIYEVAESQRDELLELARKSRHQPWWGEYRLVPNASVVGFEDDAAGEEIEQRLELRMHRQELLTRKGPPDLWFVLDEATLRRPVGGPAVMRVQLQRLVELSALPNVTLQVLPFSAGPHAGMDGEFTIFSFSDPADPDLVFIENSGGDLYLERPDRTQRYRLMFSHLQAAALNTAESIRALADVQQQLPEPERG